MYDVKVALAIGGIPARDWDALATGASFYLSHDWLAYMEQNRSVRVRYVLAHDDGGLVAAAPVYSVPGERSPLYALSALGLTEHDSDTICLAGSRRCHHNAPLLRPGLSADARRTALDFLSAGVLDVMRDHGADEGWWLYVRDDAVAELAASAGCAVPLLLDLDASIPLPGDSFDDYLGAFSRKRRARVRQELAAFRAAGYRLDLAPLGDRLDELAGLLCGTQRRHGHEMDPASAARYLASLADGVRAPGAVLRCHLDDALVGYGHYYDFGGTLWLRSTGYDYARLLGAAEYFVVCYYELVATAYATGRDRVHLGIKSIEPKVRRGATATPLWAVPFGRAAEHWTAGRARAFNRRAADRLGGELGPYAGASISDTWARFT
ncbi:hypothetical protein [Spongiactinospora sp. TRM90649]|uniref:hypothetical protein n=1 Tax=Spongiactinospora sp. TRM90649 TaxID=3031114 RepID=UPI0023F96F7A|nr:hypothetical protein [Spongiactinospora sp. TRM90649]MDF5756209.1 hypothetical protein [Spongiactinospora sp. TRM90649]